MSTLSLIRRALRAEEATGSTGNPACHHPVGVDPRSPPRLNFAGFCVYCGDRECHAESCLKHHELSEWQVCNLCDGSGFDKSTRLLCNCYGGLENMAYSMPCRRPRPSRLTFAGWCIWCVAQWCTSKECIERHAQSEWIVCPDCGGRGFQEYDVCGCFHGLAEAGPITVPGGQ